MKLSQMKWAAGIFAVLLLAACSSGGGGGIPVTAPGSTMSITTVDAAGTSSTFTANASNSIITAHTDPVQNKTVIEICSDVDNDNDCSRVMILTLDGTSAQKYAMTSQQSLSQIVYHDDETETGVLSHYLSDTGEVDVDSIDDSGKGNVKGSFTANLACNSGCSGNIAVTGTYDIALNR